MRCAPYEGLSSASLRFQGLLRHLDGQNESSRTTPLVAQDTVSSKVIRHDSDSPLLRHRERQRKPAHRHSGSVGLATPHLTSNILKWVDGDVW
mmetsp:Transcript_24175/g.52367  ORF Transcript_24175/g.52367 Transcript_24175/m.52367 type:complete len:93 (+) Transcript_24175:3-281(+)